MFTTYKCSNKDAVAFLGGANCNIPRMTGFALWAKGTTFPTAFGKTDLDNLIKAESFIGSIMADGIENNDAEATYSESLMKIRSQTDRGRKGWNFTFRKSPCFHSELNKLNNSENWAFTPILEDGSIMVYRGKDGVLRPFPVKIFVGMYMLPIMGVEESGTVVGIDLMPNALNNMQENGVVLENSEIDFSEIEPVAALNIEIVYALTSASTSIQVKANGKCSDVSVLGLTNAQYWKLVEVTDDKVTNITAVSYNAANKVYTLTFTADIAENKVYQVKLSENGSDVVIVGNNAYAGESALITAV